MEPKRWYENGLRFKCTQCGNCCKNHGAYSYVYLAEHDVQAIAAYLELTRSDFLRQYCKQEDGWICLRMDEPACPFLEPLEPPGHAPPEGTDSKPRMGCRIYPVRPKQCATWPFWKENLKRGVWDGPVKDCCPGIGQGELTSADEADRLAEQTEAWYEND